MTEQPAVHPNWARLIEDKVQPWEVVSRETLSNFRVIVEDRVRLPHGEEITYQYRARGPRAVFVMPVTAAGEAVLIRQYRYPLRATITEVVAGGVEQGENFQDAARRELLEEVGGVSTDWVALPAFYPQPSFSGVIFYPFLALNVELGDTHHESTEIIEPVVLPLVEAYRMLDAGEIHDGPSSLVMLHARRIFRERGLL